MRGTQWDRVASSTPNNKLAAVIRDGGKGDPDVFSERVQNKGFSLTPYVLRSHHSIQKQSKISGRSFVNYTGLALGRLTVLGVIDKEKNGLSNKDCNGLRWSVKCKCGTYSIFKTKTIRMALGNKPRNKCSRCDHNEWIAMGAPLRKGEL